MDLTNISNRSTLIAITLLLLLIVIYGNVSEQLTLKSYIVTNYMYIFYAFLLIIFLNEEKIVPEIRYGIKLMGLFILTLILITLLHTTSKQNQPIKHLIWFIFIVCMATMLKPIFDIAKDENILNMVLIRVGVMFLVMTYFAYSRPISFYDSWYPLLYGGLISLIVSRLMNFVFSDIDSPSTGFFSREFVISTIAVFLFNGFLLYDTQKIIKEGIILNFVCKGKDHLSCADYPVKSMSIILDIINLFSSTTSISRRNIA